MAKVQLEHINFTVSDSAATAKRLCDLFDWKVRWWGEAKDGGTTYHVGTDDQYVAVYTPDAVTEASISNYAINGGMNHIGVVVDDIDAMETKVASAGYEPHSHADYEPGKRFYFDDEDGIEFEVVSYL